MFIFIFSICKISVILIKIEKIFSSLLIFAIFSE